jgi:hypothetical protein
MILGQKGALKPSVKTRNETKKVDLYSPSPVKKIKIVAT